MNELKGLKFSHTSLTFGYVSRKNSEGLVRDYKGRFGKGKVVLSRNFESTRYCYISYYLEA